MPHAHYSSPGRPASTPTTRRTTSDVCSVVQALMMLRPLATSPRRGLSDEERDAVALLYRGYAPMLTTVARQLVRNTSDAEDLVHDVFCRVPWLIGQYRGGGLGGWLKRITVCTALMHLRKARRRREEDLLDHWDARIGMNGECFPVLASEREELRAALHQLSESLRKVVVMRFYLGFTHQEIAQALAITPNASEVRLCRALKRLRETLDPDVRSIARGGDGQPGAQG